MKIGSHVSNSGEQMLYGAVKEALMYEASSLMVYLGPPQNSIRKNVESFKIKEAKDLLASNNLSTSDIIVHGPYIVNLAQNDDNKRSFAVDFIVKEILIASQMGAKYYIIHPGSHVGFGYEIGIALISKSLKEILKKTSDSNVIILVETMAGKGSECCYTFEQVKKLLNYANSQRVKVCLDTCHIHDAGYDIVNNYQEVLEKFDSLIGLENIKVLHINDSANDCGSRKDRHANIGFGKIGFETLNRFVHDERFESVTKILETPYIVKDEKKYPPYKEEIKMLRNAKFDNNIIDNIINE